MNADEGRLGIVAAVWSGISVRDKNIVMYLHQTLALGLPAAYLDSTGASLQVFEHKEWQPEHVSVLAVVVDNLASIDPGYTVPMDGPNIDRAQLASDMLSFANSNGRVAPTTETTWKQVLDAQGVTKAKMVMGNTELPDTSDYRIFCIGDSKTDGESWPNTLRDSLTSATGDDWGQGKIQFAYSGASADDMIDYVNANIGALEQTPTHVLISLGANDVKSGLPTEATWKADMSAIIDACLAKWPSCEIYVARAWRRDHNSDCATMLTWVSTIVAGYGSGVYVGPDETTWLENGDDGATYTSDGVHYNVAGNTECAAQWEAVLNP